MGEMSKQVSVNNWGMCFLDRLNKFFNKTEYCDLTLQFDGNVQLKVCMCVKQLIAVGSQGGVGVARLFCWSSQLRKVVQLTCLL